MLAVVAARARSSRFARLAEHPRLVGDRDADGAAVADRARRLSIIAIVTANVVGALDTELGADPRGLAARAVS